MKQQQIENKYGEYFQEIEKYKHYLDNAPPKKLDSRLLEQTSSDDNNHEKSQSEYSKKHEQNMREVKLHQLANNIAKQKTLLRAQNQSLVALNLSHNMIDLQFIKTNSQILGELFQQHKIKDVDLSFNLLNNESISLLTQLLMKHNPYLKYLNLKHNKLNSTNPSAFTQLFQIPNLKLDLSFNALKDITIQSLLLESQEFLVESLLLQQSQLTGRSGKALAQNLKLFKHLKSLDLSFNDIPDEILDNLQVKLQIHIKHREFGLSLPQQQSPDIVIDASDMYFQDVNDLLTLRYIFEKTRLIIDNRVLNLSQQRIDHIFPKESKIIAKFLNIYHKSLIQVKQQEMIASSSDKEESTLNINLAPVPLPSEVIQASLDLISIFREKVLKNNVCVLDLSENMLADANLNRGINLLKICSHRLSVLKLDGNTLAFQSLQALRNVIKKLGITNIKVLSMRDCGLRCQCSETDSMNIDEWRSYAMNNKCQCEMLTRILEMISPHLSHLDLSYNYKIGSQFMKHLASVKLPHLKTLFIEGIYTDIDDVRQIKSYLKNNPQILQFEILSQHIAYNPEVVQYVKYKIKPVIAVNREIFKKVNKIENIEREDKSLSMVIVNQMMYKNLDHLYLCSDTNDRELVIMQAIDFQTYEKFILAPCSSNLVTMDQHVEDLYLKRKDIGYFNVNGKLERFYIYENFEISLLDLLNQRNYQDYSGLTKIQLAKLILDFYDQFITQKHLSFFFHTSQLVLTKNAQNTHYTLKLLPFTPYFNYQVLRQQTYDQNDVITNKIKSTLNQFINDQVLNTNKLKVYSLRKYWKYIFSYNSNKPNNEKFLHKQTLKIQRLIAYIKGGKAMFDRESLQCMIVVLAIVCDIFDMELKFKKGKNPNIQMDKLLINFYLKMNEQQHDNDASVDIDLKSVSSLSVPDLNINESQLADSVYLRLSQLLNQ